MTLVFTVWRRIKVLIYLHSTVLIFTGFEGTRRGEQKITIWMYLYMLFNCLSYSHNFSQKYVPAVIVHSILARKTHFDRNISSDATTGI